mgnify:CR=1 FL=1
MEKMLKFNANDLLDSFNREMNQDEMNELYKALIAYNMGLATITDYDDSLLEKVIDYYFENDNISGLIQEDIMQFADEVFAEPIIDEDEEVEVL